MTIVMEKVNQGKSALAETVILVGYKGLLLSFPVFNAVLVLFGPSVPHGEDQRL
jgi:hypothetical protein